MLHQLIAQRWRMQWVQIPLFFLINYKRNANLSAHDCLEWGKSQNHVQHTTDAIYHILTESVVDKQRRILDFDQTHIKKKRHKDPTPWGPIRVLMIGRLQLVFLKLIGDYLLIIGRLFRIYWVLYKYRYSISWNPTFRWLYPQQNTVMSAPKIWRHYFSTNTKKTQDSINSDAKHV